MMLKRALKFQEFDPQAYAKGPDWTAMIARYVLFAIVIAVPTTVFLLSWLPTWYRIFAASVAVLYIPALAFLRCPRVTVTSDYRINFKNPRSVSGRALVDAGCAAVAYFFLLGLAVIRLGG